MYGENLKKGWLMGEIFYNSNAIKNDSKKLESALSLLKQLNIIPVITLLEDRTIIQVNECDLNRLPKKHYEGNGDFATFFPDEWGYIEPISVRAQKRKIAKQKERAYKSELRKKNEKENPIYRSISHLQMLSKTQMCGTARLDGDENYRKIPVKLSVEEYVKIHEPKTKEYAVSESDNFYILTCIKKGNVVYTRLFGKFDEGRSSGGVSGLCESLYETEAAIREKEAKKQADEPSTMAIRGDGSVTTLDRLLSGEPDIAPPGTAPRLNI
jgi:hypothetical protein